MPFYQYFSTKTLVAQYAQNISGTTYETTHYFTDIHITYYRFRDKICTNMEVYKFNNSTFT